MKRFLLVLILLALLTIPALAQEPEEPKESPYAPICLSFQVTEAGLVLCLAALKVVRK